MERLSSFNPATGETLGAVEIFSAEQVHRVVERAREGLNFWQEEGIQRRVDILKNFASLLLHEEPSLARLITLEQGKILKEATAELIDGASRVRYFCAQAPDLLMPRQKHFAGFTAYVEQLPLGVVGAIKPWNFPLGIPLWTIVPALLAGNTVVFKPSELTPLIGARIVELLHKAGVPASVLQLVQGLDATGQALSRSAVQMIGFVGSQAVGASIMRDASDDMKRLSLEMGGKDPMVVLEDADLMKASSAAVAGAFKNCGQVCCSVERVYVHHTRFRAFVDMVVELTKALKIGSGLDEDSQLGPLVSQDQRKRVLDLFEDARCKGAKILTGQGCISGPGYFMEPSVMVDVPASARLYSQEIFGPILQIESFDSESSAISMANQFAYGLSASVWSEDIGRATRVLRKLEAGTRAVNQIPASNVELPWGGVKSSGFGRMLAEEGILEFTETITTRLPAESSI